MKKLVAVVMGCMLAATLAGCGGGPSNETPSASNSESSSQSTQAASEPENLAIIDSGYVISQSGYVHYAVEIQNPNPSYAAQFANIVVTGKHADGTIAFSDEWTVADIMPSSTTYWATQAGNGSVQASDTVEFSVTVNKRNWIASDQTIPADLYTFSSVSAVPDRYMGMSATGEITLTQDVEIDSLKESSDEPIVVCVLKDANGSIVTGFSGYLNSELNVGTPTAFEIRNHFDVPEYATLEMHANPWM